MNLQPMSPNHLTASGESFNVLCCFCGKSVNSTDVLCDTDGKFGDYYCGFCAILAECANNKNQEQENEDYRN